MLDIKYIRENSDKVKQGCQKKQTNVDIDKLLDIDKKRRELLQKIEKLKAEQNKISGKDQDQIEKAKELKKEIKGIEPELAKIGEEYIKIMRTIPNIPLDDVIDGDGEEGNKVLREEGQKPDFSEFKPKDYLEIAEKLNIIDIQRAAKTSGSRFGYIKGGAVLLEFALVQLAFKTLGKHDFVPVVPPVMLKREAMEGMGYLDRGADEVYHLEKDDLYLVGTSEQSIGAMHMNEVFQEQDLPKRYMGFSTCFRREAGAYGKDTKGILRVHQFDKIEMFSFCKPENSPAEHELILKLQEELMKKLKLPYQVVHLSTGDISASSASTYDIETWMPGQNTYRETHSTSNCTDWQARRLNTRYKSKDGIKFVHTLNGTAFAIGRMIIAIIENYQQEDGSVKIPEALQEYMDGIKEIKN